MLDVAFDRFADPSFAAPIDGVGKNKVALQHDNLLSAHAALKGDCLLASEIMCPFLALPINNIERLFTAGT